MFFILKGIVKIHKNDFTIAELNQGAYFGEMALINGKPSIRGASAKAVTNVSIAILSLDDFNLICEAYPDLKVKMIEESKRRI
jgi:CRP-like cAMP-binding protein